MLIDFLIQGVLAGLFWGGMVGMGLGILQIYKFRFGNIFFDSGVAYFMSLCLYVIGAVSVLYAFPWKIPALQIFTGTYLLTSWILFSRFVLQKQASLLHRASAHKMFFGIGLLAVLCFFLQIYHTSILDEWLHRPVVKSFVENGIFPMVNPLSPHQDYVHSYHYGTQVASAAIQTLTVAGVSESLDIFKLSYFIAAFVLLYGILLHWIKRDMVAAFGSILVLFSGSSFFLLDSFSVSHIWSFKQLASGWPLNPPTTFSLTGITWINLILSVAFIFFLEQKLRYLKRITILEFIFLGVFFIGFFLISEIFALLVLGVFILAVTWSIIQTSKKKILSLFLISIFLSVIIAGIYLTGGVVGNFVTSTSGFFRQTFLSHEVQPQEISVPSPLSLRMPSDWGYPAERKILRVREYPVWYLQSFLLEVCLIILLGCAVYRKQVIWRTYPIFFGTVAIGFLVPFLFSTPYGTLNLAKMTSFSLLVLHVIGFALMMKVDVKRSIRIFLFILFLFAAIPGILIGTNIQWRWVSHKGKEQSCSQNPLCYTGEFTDLLRKFERDYPGFKKVAVDAKNGKKVVDLTNSYIYGYDDPEAEYIIETPESAKQPSKAEYVKTKPLELLLSSGQYRISRLK